MNRDELEKRNVGENLDALMTLDPRGYGVCRILYAGARAATGEPLTMHAAEVLCKAIKPGDAVLLLTGFVLLPHKVPEMDGTVSTLLLARALVLAFGAKPIIVCPAESTTAIEKCTAVVGLHAYESLDTVRELPLSIGVVALSKDAQEAAAQSADLLVKLHPTAIVSTEASGPNAVGINHNAVGKDVTAMQARNEVLWQAARAVGLANIAIGDLGNEIGMGTLADHIKKYIPFTAPGECQCGCGGGTLAATCADNVITATCSDWGCYGLIAAIAYLKKNMDILHREEMEGEVMRVLARNGIIDMTGSLLPGVDGFDTRMNVGIVSLMRQCTAYAVRYSHNSDHWFGPVLDKGFFG